MTKVEDLRVSLLVSIGDYERCQTRHVLEVVITAHINALIAAARQEGEENGIEKEHDRLFKLMSESCCYPIDGDKLFAGPQPMSVRELLNVYAGWYATDVGDRIQKLSAYESAIRSKVISETATDILWREWTNRFPIDPRFTLRSLPISYGDALPIKEPPCKS